MSTPSKKRTPSRLEKLAKFEEKIRLEQMGEQDFEYRDHLECIRLRVLAEMKLERGKMYANPVVQN